MNPPRPRRIVIVDGYSTGRELVAELRHRHVHCIHLQSTPALPEIVAGCFDPQPYDSRLGHLGSPQAAAEVLARDRPDAVVAGSEWGVLFAEELAQLLGLPTNHPAGARARRDKFEMVETVARAGLRTARQLATASAPEALRWAAAHQAWPVVVKPLSSAGSDGVFICSSPQEIRHAFASALDRRNLMGDINEQLLLQSYLDGPQYIVNTISHHGRHRVTDAWHMAIRTLPGSAIVMDEMHLLDPSEPRTRALIDYTLDMLTALGIENGAAHTELKWTRNGPAMIEVGARLMGAAMDRDGYAAAGMQTQASAWADLLTTDRATAQRLIGSPHFSRRKALSKVFFSFAHAGTVEDVSGLARLRTLPSFEVHHRALRAGDRVWKTADTLACGGAVYLVHEQQEVVDADLHTLRTWERDGLLYRVRSDAPERCAA